MLQRWESEPIKTKRGTQESVFFPEGAVLGLSAGTVPVASAALLLVEVLVAAVGGADYHCDENQGHYDGDCVHAWRMFPRDI